MVLESKTFEINFPINVSCDFHSGGDPQGDIVVLLHGFQESKERLFTTLGQYLLPVVSQLIVPNAPFPVPVIRPDGYKEGYAWYFRSDRLGKIIIHPEVNHFLFSRMVQEYQLASASVSVVGYSQGGYIMPRFYKELSGVRQLIGLSCGARPEEYEFGLQCPVHFIHSEDDPVIDVEVSKKNFEEIQAFSKGGQFYLSGRGHKVCSEKIETVKSLLIKT